jgi:DNA-binding CsgD family transcriptional regulator
MKGRPIQWRFGGQILGWGLALAAGALLLAWADWQRLARTHFADIALLLVAVLFLGIGLWLGFAVWNRPAPPPGNPAAVASLGLTPREVEVLALLAAGQANKEIARALGVSPNTVKTHLARLYEKLGATSRTAAIAQARALGIVG